MQTMRIPLLILLVAAALPALEVGDQAPGLDTVTWLKSGPVALGARPVVVEFWATWCGPCLKSIPHLTALGKRHGGKLAIVGLSDEDRDTVTPFVAAQGARMDYAVGLADQRLHDAYMEGKPGIPQAFVVGADGLMWWAGHPMALDRVLDQVVAGTFDRAAEGARAKRSADLQALLQQDPAGDEDGLMRRVLAKTREILAADPTDSEALELQLELAKHWHDDALARATIEGLPVATLDAATAARIAQSLITADSVNQRLPDLALRLARRAVEADPEAAAGQAALAQVLHTLGLPDLALAAQERAAAADPQGEGATLGFYREAKRLADLVRSGAPLTPPPVAMQPAAMQPDAVEPSTAPDAADTGLPKTLIP